METKVCYTCSKEITGGIYLLKGERKIYFCSTKCEHDYDRNKESEASEILSSL